MELYISSKLVLAKPMNKKEYNDYMGYFYNPTEPLLQEGYLIEFKSNLKSKDKVSVWLNKEEFEKSHIKVDKSLI